MIKIRMISNKTEIVKTVTKQSIIGSDINASPDFLIDKFIVGAENFDDEILIKINSTKNNEEFILDFDKSIMPFILIDNHSVDNNQKIITIGQKIQIFNAIIIIESVEEPDSENTTINKQNLMSIMEIPNQEDFYIYKQKNIKKFKKSYIAWLGVIIWLYLLICVSIITFSKKSIISILDDQENKKPLEEIELLVANNE